MLRYAFVLLLICGQAAIAKGWEEISPLDYCPKFKIKYQQIGESSYTVRVPTRSNYIEKKLKDINDLSSLTDLLVEKSLEHCSNNTPVLAIERDSIVFEVKDSPTYQSECKMDYNYTGPYVDLLKDLVGALQYSGNRCDQLLSYTKLQTKVNELADLELIKIESPGDVFHSAIKLFTDDQTDDLVDLYATCGVAKNSHKFVENLILIEAKKACLMPSPPGLMDFEDAKKVAQEIGQNYQNLGISSLKDKKDEITHEAIMGLTKAVMHKEIDGLLGPMGVDAEEFANGLSSYQELKTKKLTADNIDYITEVFAIDATFEVAKKALPLLGSATFKDKLPETWSDTKKENFLDTVIIPSMNDTYESCIQNDASRLSFDSGNPDQRLQLRKKLKDSYCRTNPEQCTSNSCGGKVNLISNDPEVANSQVIQACVMKAMLVNIRPIIKSAIQEQRDTFAQFFDLNEALSDEITEIGFSELNSCVSEKVATHLDLDTPMDLTKKHGHLQRVSTSAFTKIVTDCSSVSEEKIAQNLYELTLRSQPALKQSFKSAKGNKGGDPLGQGVNEIIAMSYSPCMYKQNQSGVKANPVLCRPIVEMTAAGKVIQNTISDLFKDAGLKKNPSAALAMKEFENCSEEAFKETLELTGTTQGPYPLATNEDASSYLDKNPAFLNCVKKSVVTSASIIGGTELEKTADKSKDAIKDKEYFLSFKPNVSKNVAQCFDRKLSKISTWSEFTSFNDSKGLDQLKEECGQDVSELLMPKVLKRETMIQLNDLKGQGLLRSDTQIDLVMDRGIKALKEKYKLKQNNNEQIIKNAMAVHLNAGGTQDSFIEEFGGSIKEEAIKSIFQNLRKNLSKSKGLRSYSSFFKAITPQCINTLLDQYSNDLAILTKKMQDSKPDEGASESTLEETLIDLLSKGLEYQTKLGAKEYYQKMEEVSKVCKDPEQYKTPMALARSGAFDFILKAQVQNSTAASFRDSIKAQCLSDLTVYGTIPEEDIMKACEATSTAEINDAFKELLSKIENDPEALRFIPFIRKRHINLNRVIDEKLASPTAIESQLFDTFSLLSYIHENFTDVIANEKNVKEELNQRVVRRLFNDKSEGSFADQFVKEQIEAGMGLAAFGTIKEQITPDVIESSVGWKEDLLVDKNKVLNKTVEGLESIWKPRTLEEFFSWNDMEASEKEKLINVIYDNGIVPSIKNEQMKSEAITEAVSHNLNSYTYPGSRRSFKDKIMNSLSRYVIDNVGDTIGVE